MCRRCSTQWRRCDGARWRRARTAFADGFRRRRGYLYATDRNGAGLDIIELHGKAKSIGMGQE